MDPVETLSDAVRRVGPVIAWDAARCRGVLADLGMEQGLASALVAAVACHSTVEVTAGSLGESSVVRYERLSRRVHEQMAIDLEAARWAIAAWSSVLSDSDLNPSRADPAGSGAVDPSRPSGAVTASPEFSPADPTDLGASGATDLGASGADRFRSGPPVLSQALRTGPPGARMDYTVGPGQVRSGGQGTLFEAVLCTDRLGPDLFGRRVGLKQLTGITRERWLKIQERSRRLAAVRHPGLVQHLETFEGPAPCATVPAEDECDLYYSSHLWVDGTSLADLVGDGCAPADTLPWVVQLAETIDFLHDQDDGPIAHRDIHPGNVVISPDGRAVIIDYETALPHVDGASTNLTAGSLGFIPPERAIGREAPADAGDRWQLGMLTVYALLGHPQGALTASQLAERLAEKLADRVRHPGAAVEQITAMLAANPSDRPSRSAPWAAELATSLRPLRRRRFTQKRLAAEGHVPASSSVLGSDERHVRRRRAIGAGIAAAVVVAGAAFAAVVITGSARSDRVDRTGATTAGPATGSRDGAAPADSPPEGPCPDEAGVVDYYRSSIPGDPVAGAALGAEWASRDQATVGCPDVARRPSHLGNFWVSSLTQGTAGPTLVVVPDDRSDARRQASVVFSTARRYFQENADILSVIENRRSFGPGDLQLFQFDKGECSALSRLGSEPTAPVMPPAVLDIAVRAAVVDRGVPFIAGQRQVRDTQVFTIKFASAVFRPDGPPVASVDAVAPIDVTLRPDGTATGAARRSTGRSCPVEQIRAMEATAQALAALAPPEPNAPVP